MEDQSPNDQKESRLYQFPRNWLEIVIVILLMIALVFCLAYFSASSPIVLTILGVLFLFLWWPLFDALKILPSSTAGIVVSKERITLLKRNGKEKKSVTEVIEVKTGGLGRRVKIVGLNPEEKRTVIELVRKDLTREQYKDLTSYLQQLFPAGN